MTSPWPTPFRRIGPAAPASPVVIAVAHAGRHYPATLLADAAVPQAVLEQLEDRHADLLVGEAVRDGAVAIVGQFARAWIDLNRGPDDAEPANGASASPRARSGLGLVPSRLNGRPLTRRTPDPATVADRLAQVHEPFHRALSDALAAAMAVHGRAVLVDCHSMPPVRGGAQVVVGDLHGRSADAQVVRTAMEAMRGAGYRVALNRPYAGAHTLARHGRPGAVDAIQIELDRLTYLDAAMREPAPGLAGAADMIALLCRRLGDMCRASDIAAE